MQFFHYMFGTWKPEMNKQVGLVIEIQFVEQIAHQEMFLFLTKYK